MPEIETASPRRRELLEAAYAYVGDHGISGLALRPLAAEIGSSPRVILFLFGSKEGLVAELLARARDDELALLAEVGAGDDIGLVATAQATWGWLAAPEHRGVLRLWVESYARSLVEPDGPWGEFARRTVHDWLALLARAQPAAERRTAAGRGRRTLALAVLRGAMLDLLATGDVTRTTRAVQAGLAAL